MQSTRRSWPLLGLMGAGAILGLLGLAAFLWCLKSCQYDDLDGAVRRILLDEDPPEPKETDRPQDTMATDPVDR